MSEQKYGAEAGLPVATLSLHQTDARGVVHCEVLVDGKPVAYIPHSGVELEGSPIMSPPRLKLIMLTETASIETLDPPRMRRRQRELQAKGTQAREASSK